MSKAKWSLWQKRLKVIETEINQREAEWEKKHRAPEGHLSSELALKEEVLKQTEELQKQISHTEEKWLTEEQEWLKKESKMEEEIELLMQENAQLQVRHISRSFHLNMMLFVNTITEEIWAKHQFLMTVVLLGSEK